MDKMTYSKAIEMGGTEWTGGDNRRVYFNSDAQKAALYGVTIQGKDGYIGTEKISRNNLYKITTSRPYFNVKKDELAGMVAKFAGCAGYAQI